MLLNIINSVSLPEYMISDFDLSFNKLLFLFILGGVDESNCNDIIKGSFIVIYNKYYLLILSTTILYPTTLYLIFF